MFDWEAIGIYLPYDATGEVRPECPKCGCRANDAFSCDTDTGAFQCFKSHCGYKGYAKKKGMGYTTYRRRCQKQPPQSQPVAILSNTQASPHVLLNKTWKEAVDISEGDPVVRYLRRRDVMPDTLPDGLRYHPRLLHVSADKVKTYHPAMLAIILSPDDESVCIHRTYLTPDGYKAPVDQVKKMMVPTEKGAVMGAY